LNLDSLKSLRLSRFKGVSFYTGCRVNNDP
jgi:hypothetical protein